MPIALLLVLLVAACKKEESADKKAASQAATREDKKSEKDTDSGTPPIGGGSKPDNLPLTPDPDPKNPDPIVGQGYEGGRDAGPPGGKKETKDGVKTKGRMPKMPLAAARVTFGAVSVTGGLDKDDIRRRLRTKEGSLRYCREQLEGVDLDDGGQIIAKFTVDDSGRVVSCAVTGDDSELAACVKGVIQTVSFPRPKAGKAEVSYQLAFATD